MTSGQRQVNIKRFHTLDEAKKYALDKLNKTC